MVYLYRKRRCETHGGGETGARRCARPAASIKQGVRPLTRIKSSHEDALMVITIIPATYDSV